MPNSLVLKIPSKEEMERIAAEARSYEEPRLRWVVPPHTTTAAPKLQEGIRWRSQRASGIEWRDVPTVVLDAALAAGDEPDAPAAP